MAKRVWNYLKKKSRRFSEEEEQDVSVNQTVTSTITASVEIFDHLLKTFKFDVLSAGNTTHDVFQYLMQSDNINLTVKLIPYIDNINLQDEDGNTLLHLAAQNKNFLICSALVITEKPDINIVNKEGKSVLHVASEVGCLSALKQILLLLPVDVNIKDYLKFTPLHYALLKGHDEVAMLLLSRGADLNIETYRKESGFHLAFAKNCSKVIKKIETEKYLENIKMVNYITIYGNTILHHINSVVFLSKLWNNEMEKLRNKPNYRKDTPLYYACIRGDPALLRFLIEVKGCLVEDNIGENLIHIAVRKNLIEMISTLRRIYNGNEINKFGINCFESALIHGNDNLALTVYNTENPKDYINEFHGNTSSHYAAIGCETLPQMLNLQLDPSNDNFFKANKYGMLPYLYLILYNKQTILAHLFDENTNQIQNEDENEKKSKKQKKNEKKKAKQKQKEKEVKSEKEREKEEKEKEEKEKKEKEKKEKEKKKKDELLCEKVYCVNALTGNTSLHYAVKSGSSEMLELVCNKAKSHLNMPNNTGQTALNFAASQNNDVMVKILLKEYGTAHLSVSSKDTLLVDCIKNNANPKIKLLSMLLDYGCDINLVVDQTTALLLAVQRQQENVVKFLLSRGAIVYQPVPIRSPTEDVFRSNIVETCDSTVLHSAAKQENAEITRALLTYGAQKMINRFNFFGETPLHCALRKYQYSQVSVLLAHGADYDLAVKPSGDTPLHLAARSGSKNIVKLLLKYRPKISANNKNHNAIVIAAANKFDEIYDLLDWYENLKLV